MRRMTAVCIVIFALGLSTTEPLAAKSEPAETRHADKRLDRLTSIRQGRIYLGEFVEKLSRQTGVPLSVSAKRGSVDGIELFVYFKDRPLRECMDAIRELFSSRFDEWEWQLQDDKKSYVLRHQRSPSDAALAARQALMSKWAEDFRTYLEILHLPDSQRTARARQRPDLFGGGAIQAADAVAARISQAQMAALLKGAFVPLEGGPSDEKARDLLQALGGPAEGDNGNLTSGFYIDWSAKRAAPSLFVRSQNGSAISAMGNLYWDYTWLRLESTGWQCKYDPEPLAMIERVARPEPGAATTLGVNTLIEWLQEAHRKQGLNVIADPASGPRGAAPLLGRNAQKTVLLLVFRGDLNARRIGGTQLLRHETALVDFRRRLVPWPQVKTLRTAADANGGFLPFRQLVALSELSDEQAAGLAEEFPDLDSSSLPRWRAILQFYLNLARPAQEQITSPKGIPFRDCGLVARNTLLSGPNAAKVIGIDSLASFTNETTVVFRMEKTPVEVPVPPRAGKAPRDTRGNDRAVQLVWEVRAPGRPVRRDTLPQRPRRPLLPEPLDAPIRQLDD